MRELLRGLMRGSVAAALLAALLIATHREGSDPTQGAILRIAIRTTAGTVQDCRKLSSEELEALPMHMRRPEVCESRAVPYRLQVRIDDRAVLDRIYTASGLRGDRPLTVDQELVLGAGVHDVNIAFTPTLAEHAPPTFAFHGPVDFADARIRVATWGIQSAAFEIR